MNIKAITPWHNPTQFRMFCDAWKIPRTGHSRLLAINDKTKQGCAKTKNEGIRLAIEYGADIVIVLDDDCYPAKEYADVANPLNHFINAHVKSLTTAQPVELCPAITDPPSRGTPYYSRHLDLMPAASMGYWQNVGDYDALGQLIHGAQHPMEFRRIPMFGQYFAMSGMNIAFWTKDWPWFKFVDVARFDDIWMGFIFQRYAYDSTRCISLNGPDVLHSRQSNVWANLRDEAKHLEDNESLWMKAMVTPNHGDYFEYVRALSAQLSGDAAKVISDLA